jgi:hypothetical protein
MLWVGMEKFRIAMYGMAQVTAIVYGLLASGATTKCVKQLYGPGTPMPAGFYWAQTYRDYGIFLLLLVIAWTVAVSYFLLPRFNHGYEERTLSFSGLALAILFAVIGTFFAVQGMSPLFSTTYGMSDH